MASKVNPGDVNVVSQSPTIGSGSSASTQNSPAITFTPRQRRRRFCSPIAKSWQSAAGGNCPVTAMASNSCAT